MPTDVFGTNPWFIDSAGDKSATIPTYRNGVNMAYHITKVINFGATVVAGDDVQILDADDNIKLQFKVRTQYCDIVNFDPPLEIKGLNTAVIDHGDLLIYTG